MSVSATENALLKADAELNVVASGGSFYGSGTVLAVGGQIATNVVLSKADAYIDESSVTTNDGDVSVSALNSSGIDATILSATTSGDKAFGFTIAFNSIGWKSQNILFNAVDALLGDPLISEAFHGEQPAEALAYVLNSDVDSAGGVHVNADNAAILNATLSNAATSVASALYGANGKAIGGLLASNKVSSRAIAYIAHDDGYLTSGAASQIVDVTPSTLVTLHHGFGAVVDTARRRRARRRCR